jgi:hypothetical protein
VTAFKLSLPGLALRRGSGPREAPKRQVARSLSEPLPPILALEGEPDPSLRCVIDELAQHLGAAVWPIEAVAALAVDPDFESVVAVVLTRPRCPLDLLSTVRDARVLLKGRPLAVLAPRPLTNSVAGSMPVDPAFVAPPVTVERLIFALESTPH